MLGRTSFSARLRAVALAVIASMLIEFGIASAQQPDEDTQRMCPIMSLELAKQVAEKAKGKGPCEISCKGCGCKGGPGYRGPRGCVGWSDFISVCGPPPHDGCKRECEPVKAACAGAGRAWVKELAADLGLLVSFAPGQARATREPLEPKPP